MTSHTMTSDIIRGILGIVYTLQSPLVPNMFNFYSQLVIGVNPMPQALGIFHAVVGRNRDETNVWRLLNRIDVVMVDIVPVVQHPTPSRFAVRDCPRC